MNEDKERVELLLNKFSPRILQCAVNIISYDKEMDELIIYLKENMLNKPDLRILFDILSKLDGEEVNELFTLSRNIAYSDCNLNDIIPINQDCKTE